MGVTQSDFSANFYLSSLEESAMVPILSNPW